MAAITKGKRRGDLPVGWLSLVRFVLLLKPSQLSQWLNLQLRQFGVYFCYVVAYHSTIESHASLVIFHQEQGY
jgi:hypothetical protein